MKSSRIMNERLKNRVHDNTCKFLHPAEDPGQTLASNDRF